MTRALAGGGPGPWPARQLRGLPLSDRQWTASLTDEELPVLATLLTEHLPEPVHALLSRHGGRPLAVRLRQVTWWPGRSVTVSWDCTVAGGPLAGQRRLVATTRPPPQLTTTRSAPTAPTGLTQTEPPGAMPRGEGAHRLSVWAVPDDPFLPALRAVRQPGSAVAVEAGVAGVPDLRMRRRTYRPTRRAVLEVTGSGCRRYLKLARPSLTPTLQQRYLDLQGYLPVPEPLGRQPQLGLLVLPSLPGRTLRSALEDPTAVLPDPQEVAALPGRFPRVPSALTVSSPLEAVTRAAELLGRLVPMAAGRITALAQRIGIEEVTDLVPAHGDYHEAQLLVSADQITGVLDVDTVGMARPADDASTMLAHLAVWQTRSAQPARVAGYARALQACWEHRLEPSDLRRRVAARVLGLAVGPFRVQQRDWPGQILHRLALAERWATSARPG